MKHILDVLPPITKVQLVGKNPSLNVAEVHRLQNKGWYTVSINEAYQFQEGFQPNLCVFNDWWNILMHTDPKRVPLFACPSSPHYNTAPHQVRADQIIKYGEFFKKYPIAYYDIHHMANFPDHPLIHSIVTSTNAALHILALHGVKRFHFNGVDAYWNGANHGYARFQKMFGLKYSGLNL